MGQVRVVFDGPRQFGGVTLTEMTVDADRLVLMSDGKVALDIPAGIVETLDGGAASRTARLRGRNQNHGRSWQPAEEAELRRLWDAMGVGELAAHFGRSRGAISSAARRLKLPERPRGKGRPVAGHSGQQPAGAPARDGEPSG
ncbi:hypothetical protein [Actinomadura sp. 7K507]|uniref:hypothetical protein n=1 Tax=Actinomadura sp. 7K507 TaxID=2530365 RepID=UPI001052F560|nr:hypothetical protein [Actinomadura sp. 7K507]TDC73032.1 hypothetical protein E1285_44895 [Actinomadura sp. 7K507]